MGQDGVSGQSPLDTLGGSTEFYNVSPSEIVALTTLPPRQQAEMDEHVKAFAAETTTGKATAQVVTTFRGERGH